MSTKTQPIIDLTVNDTTPKDIAKMLNKLLSTFYTMVLYFQTIVCVKRKPGSGLKY